MKRVKRVLIACWLAFAACDRSTSPTTPIAMEPSSRRMAATSPQSLAGEMPFRKILCFGDSITYGVTLEAISLPPETEASLTLVEGYVPKLWRALEAKYGTGFELVNSGVPGERTAEGVERLRSELRIYEPDLVLLLEGIVDVNNSNPRFPVVRENLAKMMALVKREGREVIIGTYPLLNPDGFRTSGAPFIPRLNDVIRQEATVLSVPIADHEKANDQSGQGPDGLHPNNLGYDTMANTWLSAIEALAEKLGET